jgi:recombination protein RecA
LGQGRENAKRFLRENPEIAVQLQAKIYEQVGMLHAAATSDDEAQEEEEASESLLDE